MSSDDTLRTNGHPIRSDRRQSPRDGRTVRSDADSRRKHVAGEYGEGREDQSTGVGPRRADAPPQVLNDSPGNPDTYGNVAPGRYGVHGYSGSPGHPSTYVNESGETGQSVESAGSGGPVGSGAAAAASNAVQSSRSATSADERLRELIRERLTEDPDIDAGDVTILIRDGRVTLVGTVADERTRDVVEQCVENCGARAVDNQLSMS